VGDGLVTPMQLRAFLVCAPIAENRASSVACCNASAGNEKEVLSKADEDLSLTHFEHQRYAETPRI
jgi:hypothetical protein